MLAPAMANGRHRAPAPTAPTHPTRPSPPGPDGARIVDLVPLSFRAALEVGEPDEETREVGLVWTTGAQVERYDWWKDERYLEELSLDPAHVRMDRLNAGAPLLDSHSAWSVSDMLGGVVRGSATVAKKEGRARVRFSKREAVDGVWQDVRDGLVSNVSVGYRVYAYEESRPKGNKLPVRTAIDWEPFELSMVPIPADAGASVRGQRPADTNQCQIVTRALETAPPTEERKVMEPTPNAPASETVVEQNPLATTRTAPAAPAEPPTGEQLAVGVERERVEGIILACRATRMPQATQDALIRDGVSLVEAQQRCLTELQRRGADSVGPGRTPPGVVVSGDDPLVHVRGGIREALLHRVRPKTGGDPKGFELTDLGRPYRGMTLLRIAEAYLGNQGVRTTSMGKMEIAALALGLETRAGMHTTSDFPNLLADVANKTLRAAYNEAPQTWLPISRRTTMPDFKPVKRLQIGEAPALLEVGEHGEFTFGTVGEGKEQFQLATYGRRFAITRKALVNDDTDAFSRIPTLFGRAARNLESDLVWQQITANGLMGDGVALFAAGHNNLAGAGAVISIATIGAGRAAMRVQKGLDGVTLLNVFPQFLIVPAAIETVADQFVSQNLLASQSSAVNPFAGRLSVIAEPRLDANSLTAWYLAATPDQIDIIEYAYLEGEEGPMVESRVGFEIDGLEIKCREDFAAKVIDFRGLYKNPGA